MLGIDPFYHRAMKELVTAGSGQGAKTKEYMVDPYFRFVFCTQAGQMAFQNAETMLSTA
jgi:hypothetical protein